MRRSRSRNCGAPAKRRSLAIISHAVIIRASTSPPICVIAARSIPSPSRFPAADDISGDGKATRIRFNEQHDRRYGHAAPDQSIEIVNLRLAVMVPRMEDAIARWLSQPWMPFEAAPEQRRPVVFDDPERPLEARILWRPGLAAGAEIAGPAVIEEPNSTTLIGPNDRAVVNESGHIIVTLARGDSP